MRHHRRVLRLGIFASLAANSLAGPLAAQDHPHGLLPDDAIPTAYRLDLTIIPEQERFSGHAEIDVDLKAASSALFLHGRELHMTRAVAMVDGKSVPATYSELDPLGVARLEFARPLPAGKVTLSFDYDAPFGASASGLFHIKVADRYYAWSQFESIDARAAFPSFDQPGYKTPFTVSLTTKAGYTTVSNAPETGTTKAGDLVRHQFAPTRPLPTYLVAFAVGPFASAQSMVAPTPQRDWAMPLRVIATQPHKELLAYALDQSKPIVALLEKYFDQPFPFPKLDQIASPVMGGAMENAGADIYDDSIILLGDNPPIAQQQRFGMVVAHELSHQWFGDLVTPVWWDDIWLNESFANWMGYRIGNEWRPDLHIGVGALDEAFTAMTTDALAAGRPIHQPITDNGQIDSAFDAVTYGKGGQVIAMIAAYMGDDRFRDGVRLHLKRHAYGNASTDDFFASLADAAGDPRILAAMKSFVDQQGVPVISIARTADGIKLSQSRYHLLGSSIAPEQWIIPLCLKAGTQRQCILLDTPEATLATTGTAPIMPNAGGTGYYRFSLSDADWTRLIDAGAALPPGEALALNDSLWADMRAGHADPALLVRAARAMSGNGNASAATEAGVRFAGLRRGGLIPQSALPAYRATLAAIYAPMLDRLGFDPRTGADSSDDAETRQTRIALVALLATEVGDTAIQDRLIAAAERFLAGEGGALDPAFYDAAFASMIARSGTTAASALFERGLDSEDALERSALLDAVAGSGSSAVGQWLLGQLGDKRLRATEAVSAIGDLIAEPQTRVMGFDWLVGHYDDLIARNGIFAASGFPKMIRYACSDAEADAGETALRPKVEKYGRGSLELDRALEEVRSCAALKAARGGAFASIFDPAA